MKEKENTFHCKSFELINTSIVRAMRERFLKLYHGDPMSISTANHIYGEFRKRGYSVRNWPLNVVSAPHRTGVYLHLCPCQASAASRWHCLIEDHGGIE